MEKRRKEDEVRGRDERDDGEMRCMGDVITTATWWIVSQSIKTIERRGGQVEKRNR